MFKERRKIGVILVLVCMSNYTSADMLLHEFSYGITDNTIKKVTSAFQNSQGEQVTAEVSNHSVGAIGYTITGFSSSGLMYDFDVRYQNTSLNGSDGYRIKYTEENNVDERILDFNFTKTNLGLGYGSAPMMDRFRLGIVGGLNLEYGERLISQEAKTQYQAENGVPDRLTLDDDLLVGPYIKVKVIARLVGNTYISFTPSYHKTWKAVDTPTGTIDGFQTTKTEWIEAMEAVDVIFGIGWSY